MTILSLARKHLWQGAQCTIPTIVRRLRWPSGFHEWILPPGHTFCGTVCVCEGTNELFPKGFCYLPVHSTCCQKEALSHTILFSSNQRLWFSCLKHATVFTFFWFFSYGCRFNSAEEAVDMMESLAADHGQLLLMHTGMRRFTAQQASFHACPLSQPKNLSFSLDTANLSAKWSTDYAK